MKISIIIPTYNGERTIVKAIESVLTQSFQDFEIIVVDDGSTDKTKEIVLELIEKDSRIKYIYQANSGGPARPINEGIKISKGEFLSFLEQDDEWLPEKLKNQIDFIEQRPGLGMISCGAIIKSDTSGKQRKFEFLKDKSSDFWFKSMLENKNFFYNLSTLLVRKSSYKEIYFDENLKISTDLDFYIRMMPSGFGVVSEPLVIYHSNQDSLSKSKKSLSPIVNDFLYVLEKHKQIFTQFSKAKSLALGYIGILSCCDNRKSEAWVYFKESIRGYYFNFKLYFKVILLVLFGANMYLKIRNTYFGYVRIK
jgi:glycosyltransferase involved in cell wall biosynthesis